MLLPYFMLSRRNFALILSVFAAFLICHTFVSAQKPKPVFNYKAPTRLALSGDEKGDEESPDKLLLLEKFYPVGWSKDGKFAYYTEPADEACGCYFAELTVQDLRTDKILWQKSYNSENGGADDLQKYWTKSRKEFSRKLAQYGIVPNKDFALLGLPIKTADDTVSVDFLSDVKLTEDVYNSEGSVIVKLLSKQKGAKTVYQKTYNGKGYDGVMNAAIGGILLSPFEPRSAIILIETRRGWEGPPNITNIKIIGATLNGGFSIK